jgi:hypothetical protein
MTKDKYFGSHELQARESVTRTASNRSFGLVLAGFFALLGGLSLYRGAAHWPLWLVLACGFAALALSRPRLLASLNRLWTAFGLLLHRVVSPIVLALIFFGCILPTGLLMRLFGKDPLRRRLEAAAESYWLARDPPGPAPDTFKNQF